MDNPRRPASVGRKRWGQQRLFEIPSYQRERFSMHERLAAFAASEVRANHGVATARTMKSVENVYEILDRLRRLTA